MGTVIKTNNLHKESSVGGFLFYYPGKPDVEWRIFYQRSDGAIEAMVGDTGPQQVLAPGVAKLGTPIISTFHTSSVGQGSTTFYINTSNEVCVFSYGGLSFNGTLKEPNGNTFKARSDSGLAAFVWVVNNTSHIRIAYQLNSNEVQQINWDGNSAFTWTYASRSPPTMQGSSMSFINQSPSGQDQYFRGYYQHTDNSIMELVDEPSQGYVGSFNQSLSNKTRISASYPAQGLQKFARAQGQVGVFWVNADGTISRRTWNNGSWSGTENLNNAIKVNQNSGLLAWSWVPPTATSPVKERII
ncbi:hypothetical protein CC78DRAFT_549785 [Lojkania enalia]|uniref:Fucose-specific lectin n=1 Tax=Lojkania enalia TaxID=147567 RepID=A0A9P4MWX6_9PLEO|nr:hypothetical protein CC78DRAFT_549785 [Didymosphaeria enalia]